MADTVESRKTVSNPVELAHPKRKDPPTSEDTMTLRRIKVMRKESPVPNPPTRAFFNSFQHPLNDNDNDKVNQNSLLVSAITIILESNAANKVTRSTRDDVMALLNRNLSYVEFCDILERRGVSVDHNKLAQVFFRAVPQSPKERHLLSPNISSAQSQFPPRHGQVVNSLRSDSLVFVSEKVTSTFHLIIIAIVFHFKSFKN
jgi:hypothetical protein